MSHTLRWTGFAALIALVFVGSCHMLSISLVGPAGEPESLSSLLEEFGRGDELWRRLEAAQARQHAQDQIGYALIEGRIDLAEAVRLFDALPDAPDQFQELLRLEFAGATDEERLGRLVIRWACRLLKDQPDRADTLRRRWQSELGQLGTPDSQ
jgi:hypothetical protein